MAEEEIGVKAVLKINEFNDGLTTYTSGLDKAGEKTDKFTGILSGASKIGGMALLGLSTAAVGAAAAITGLVMKATDTAGELVDMSLKTGIGVERLQELDFVSGQLGTSLETITGSMARLTRSMGSVATSEEMAKNFEGIGVAVYDANGNMRDSETVFADVLDALNKMENPAERDAIAMKLFGRSALELNPLIKAGGDEIARLSEQALLS